MSRTSAADGGAKLATDAKAAASADDDDADDAEDVDVDAADAETPGEEITSGNADDEAAAALLGEFASNARLSVNAIMFVCEPPLPLRAAFRLAHQRPNANTCNAATAAGNASSQPIACENNLLTCTAF